MGHQLRTNSEPRNRNHMLTSIARTKHAAEMRPARSTVLAGPTTQALRPRREEMKDKRCPWAKCEQSMLIDVAPASWKNASPNAKARPDDKKCHRAFAAPQVRVQRRPDRR